MKRFATVTFFALMALSIAVPAFAAADSTFQPIVSLPAASGNGGTLYGSLCDYLNSAFKLAIAAAIILAVLMIIVDGFKYMTSEAIGNKKDALGGIRSALFGLLLLLGSYLILYIVNPQILNLGVLSPNGDMLGGCTGNLNAGGASNTPLTTQDGVQITTTAIAPMTTNLTEVINNLPPVSIDGWSCYQNAGGGGTSCFASETICNQKLTEQKSGSTEQLPAAEGATCQPQ